MTEPLDWDEFRIVKAIAEAHSLAGAAQRLGINHSTIFRRLTALEARLGVSLFERERAGYRPTAAGEDMISLATVMGHTIEEFERRIAGDETNLSGHVRLTTVNTIGCLVISGMAARLLNEHPGLHIELMLTDMTLDLMRGEADIALRPIKGASPDGLLGRRLARLSWGVYASQTLIERTPEFKPAAAPWIVPAENFGPRAAHYWLDRHVESWRRVATASNDMAICELAAQGVGVALLPCYVAASKPQLKRLGDADAEIDRDLWLLAPPQTLRRPRVRALFDVLGDELEGWREVFEGGPPA